jgi:hypothetical protein
MRTLAVAAITVIALAVAGAASAAPVVSMVWTACSGPTCGAGVGTSSIVAGLGDTLTLDMRIDTTAANGGVTAVGLVYDTSVAGVASANTRPGADSINDGVFDVWDFQGSFGNTMAPASATYSTGALEYLSGVICPGPPAVGNVFTGQCGQFTTGLLGANTAVLQGDLGGGLAGQFGTNVGLTTEPVFTIGQAVFVVVPEPATGGLLALGLGALAFIGRRRA